MTKGAPARLLERKVRQNIEGLKKGEAGKEYCKKKYFS